VHVVARIGRPHGLRGEVTVQTHTDDPAGRFVPGAAFETDPPERGPLVLHSVRVHQGTFLLAFEGHPDRTAAEALRGTRLLAPGADEADEDEDAWYEQDLVGLTAVTAEGVVLGEVSALLPREAQDLLELRLSTGGTALVPFVQQLVPEVDTEAGRVVIDAPPGLLELGE
jgi:16S rRNA processing protein RimM